MPIRREPANLTDSLWVHVSFWKGRNDALCSHSVSGLTDEAKDVPDGGDTDDQDVVKGQDEGGNQQVASPAELSPAEQ